MRAGLAALARALGMEIRIRFVEPRRRQRFATLVTKEPHCLEAILTARRAKMLQTDPMLMIGNRPDLERLAGEYRLPFVRLPWADRAKAEQRALHLLEKHEIDFVILARFIKILSPNFV